jgi:hypothetical protein
MKTAFRKTALALGLMAGAALLTAPATVTPAMANSVHKEGQFGGSWSRIEPSSGYYQHRRHAGRVGPLYGDRYYRGRGYYAPRGYAAYGYGPRRGYYGAPYYYDRGPGFSITVR